MYVVCFFVSIFVPSLFDLHVHVCIYHPRAPANLTSMSVPPATIHEPNVISPTKIESVLNASALNNGRKRPRDLCMDGRYIYMYVCMYMYVCIYVHVHVCMYIHVHVYMYMYVCIYMYTHVCTVCMYIHVHVYMYMYVYTCIYVCMYCMYIYIYMYICMYVCMYVHVCVCIYVHVCMFM